MEASNLLDNYVFTKEPKSELSSGTIYRRRSKFASL